MFDKSRNQHRATPESIISDNDAVVLGVENLSIFFESGNGETQVVKDVTFSVKSGETVGIVGESGSGKSVSALAIMSLLDRSAARVEGKVWLGGRNILGLPESELRHIRGKEIGMVFQEPATALDPVFTIGSQLVETVRAHRDVTSKQAKERSIELLDAVGIALPARRFNEYPHQLSGGMKQRAMIALALSCDPDLIIADEPTTAVDVTIQAQILALLRKLSEERGVAVLFITHDLGVVAEFCSRAITLYAGEVVEIADVNGLLSVPAHPYTSGLLRAIPNSGHRDLDLYEIPGTVPLPNEMPSGCRFAPRCSFTVSRCSEEQQLVELEHPRYVRCTRARELDLPGATE